MYVLFASVTVAHQEAMKRVEAQVLVLQQKLRNAESSNQALKHEVPVISIPVEKAVKATA